jgi:hypothetical protein
MQSPLFVLVGEHGAIARRRFFSLFAVATCNLPFQKYYQLSVLFVETVGLPPTLKTTASSVHLTPTKGNTACTTGTHACIYSKLVCIEVPHYLTHSSSFYSFCVWRFWQQQLATLAASFWHCRQLFTEHGVTFHGQSSVICSERCTILKFL